MLMRKIFLFIQADACDFYINSLKSDFESNSLQLMTLFHDEKARRDYYDGKNDEYYKNIADCRNVQLNNDLEAIENDFVEAKCQAISKSMVKRESFLKSAVNYRDRLNAQMNEIVQAIRDNLESNKIDVDYMELCKKNEEMRMEQLKMKSEIREKENIYSKCKSELVDLENISRVKISELKQQRRFYMERLKRMRKEFDEEEERNKKAMRKLVTGAHGAQLV